MKPLPCTILLSLLAATAALAADSPQSTPQSANTPPKAVHRVTPVFPYNMRAAGLTGVVTVGFVVDPEGRVQEPRIVSSNNP